MADTNMTIVNCATCQNEYLYTGSASQGFCRCPKCGGTNLVPDLGHSAKPATFDDSAVALSAMRSSLFPGDFVAVCSKRNRAWNGMVGMIVRIWKFGKEPSEIEVMLGRERRLFRKEELKLLSEPASGPAN
ncbi:MAG: hypothetical protein HZA50_17380 [Planctomycetes bacterium]|nr:hypothetical protein [Planctomycetota bacterium]